MKRIYICILLMLSLNWACKKDSEFLDRKPKQVLTEEQVFGDEKQVLSLLADLYNRYVDFATPENWSSMSDFNEAFWSEAGRYGDFQNSGWGYGNWAIWDYGYIRELNLFIDKAAKNTTLDAELMKRMQAEARFIRASYYFELVKRMGGVPLILEPLTYDFSGDATYLQNPREKESAIYDFIIKEAEEIKPLLPKDVNTKSRATAAAALAMQSRAALYAASIAKYGYKTPQVSLSGGEVGIDAALSNEYYAIALKSAQEIISGSVGSYALYLKKPDNLSENFASLFYDKNGNNESIFIEDYKLQSGKVHGFTISNQPRYGAEEEEGGRINPSLNLAQSFEKLDNTFAPFETNTSTGEYVYYDNQTDIFAGRDARLAGTIILPGTTFKGRTVDIWAGYQLADGSIITGDDRGQQKTLPGKSLPEQVVGLDGPINGYEFTAQTGFYIRKYLDPAAGSGQRGVQSEVPFLRYRYAEVLLNAAEAAFELGDANTAATYMNEVRARAGLTTPLNSSQITFDRIVHERRAELAFEGHYYFDLKRWRIAHEVFNGANISKTEIVKNIGSSTKISTQPYGIWPYKIYAPGTPNDGKWIYKVVLPDRVTGADRFQLGNYYSEINNTILSNNPKIVKNPNQ
ncbi:RagB/SusD family nutrient uptake outer membrane protein [Albibacterium sp.]|uniref:RagB/SusD family nutrient uptake outer membrane protein n=1 Tax=Albibacterium sp. TaxID=2952885 RepID=UPI002C4FE729|nr:RagB/SusD family nutrient uptake outer membrane protein [Albibacterium sp.]HUH18232.1 RagB/SusD family nutrient uptake outer membrane protein [Albibacterium sp.]